jgi:hypothetical protein
MLRGVRGHPPADGETTSDALLGMSRLLVECPEIVEINSNPPLVFARGAAAADARTVVESQGT